ncbi:helix-turn-helix transcriptional regulator [uncultured Pluralibacter sp.]|uniref:helix-turn-helix transcriptional regulator n=1 Tax=uncultured Pluralibacter sp. TaxID=1490864 RepID=UPI002612FAAD|nr:helix-turn-helix transcriptional regulator [uncultured Pluralibacter sp.]
MENRIATHTNLRIREVIVITDNIFFSHGVSVSIDKYYADLISDTQNTSVVIPVVKNYTIAQAIDFLEISFSNQKEKYERTVVIVDKKVAMGFSLLLSHFKKENIFVISSEDLSFEYLHTLVFDNPCRRDAGVNTPSYALLSRLNYREKRVCRYLYLGYKAKMIGLMLGINEKTVSGYKQRIMRKIGCTKKAEFNAAIINYNRFCKNTSVQKNQLAS